ncbi:hypothetical protein FRC14_007574, partial [Serendipita sp. 396]
MAQFPPSGMPIGPQAFVLKMTPEALELLAAQLATQQQTTPSSITTASVGPSQSTKFSNGKTGSETQKNLENSLMQLVIGDAGQPKLVIGGSTFKVDAVNEQSTLEIYARHQSPVSDSERSSQSTSTASNSPLQMVAKVEGRLNIKRDLTSKVQQTVSERTARMNKEAQPRSAIILDSTTGKPTGSLLPNPLRPQQAHSTTVSKPSSPAPASRISRPVDPKIQVFTPPKSDGSPSSSTSGPRGLKHRVPDSFASLDLSIPTRWDRPQLPIRLVHLIALKSKSEAEVVTALAADADRKDMLETLSILAEKKEDGMLHLRDEGYYYLRPWCWIDYSPYQRANAAKFMRIALRNLGYDDQDEEWSYLRQPNGWLDPWRNTPDGERYYHEKEQKRASTLNKAKEDHDKLKAEALANPARMLTSSFKPGFVPNPTTVKGKKAVKEKEPKPKKEKTTTSTKTGIEREPGAPPKSGHSVTGSQSSTSAGTNNNVEPSAFDVELKIRQSGPGSASGKLAVARRLQREKEEGRTSSASTPSRSPLALPSTSTATNTRKRKSPEEDQDGFIKKRRAADTGSVLSQKSSGESQSNVHYVSKKRKGEDIDALSPPLKVRKGDTASTPRADPLPPPPPLPVASTSTSITHAIDSKAMARPRAPKAVSNEHTPKSREGRATHARGYYTTSSEDEKLGL